MPKGTSLSTFQASWVDPIDGQPCDYLIPVVSKDIAMIVFVFNIVMPGFGTLILTYYDPSGCSCNLYWISFTQGITSPLIVGYVWSILMGI